MALFLSIQRSVISSISSHISTLHRQTTSIIHSVHPGAQFTVDDWLHWLVLYRGMQCNSGMSQFLTAIFVIVDLTRFVYASRNVDFSASWTYSWLGGLAERWFPDHLRGRSDDLFTDHWKLPWSFILLNRFSPQFLFFFWLVCFLFNEIALVSIQIVLSMGREFIFIVLHTYSCIVKNKNWNRKSCIRINLLD